MGLRGEDEFIWKVKALWGILYGACNTDPLLDFE